MNLTFFFLYVALLKKQWTKRERFGKVHYTKYWPNIYIDMFYFNNSVHTPRRLQKLLAITFCFFRHWNINAEVLPGCIYPGSAVHMVSRTPVPQDLKGTYTWCYQCCQEICKKKVSELGEKNRCLGQSYYKNGGEEIQRNLIYLVYLSLPLPHSSKNPKPVIQR